MKEQLANIRTQALEAFEQARDSAALDALPALAGERRRVVIVSEMLELGESSAADHARTGDVVVLAGKGHETYQVVGAETLPLDERQVVREHLSQ